MASAAGAKDREFRRMIRLATVVRVCPSCGKKKAMLPDDIQCQVCSDEGYDPGFLSAEDAGW